MSLRKKFSLYAVVLLSGSVLMAFEITGSRLLAPYFGTTTYVWTALIGVILAALSLGYWFGGIVGDKSKNPTIALLSVLLGAAFAICLNGLFKEYFLGFFSSLSLSAITGASLSSLALFAPSSLLLGMVLPLALKISWKNPDEAGREAGKIYALSTIGSLLGTFAATLWLIPFFGSTKIQFIFSAALGLCCVLLWFSMNYKKDLITVGLVLVCLSMSAWAYATVETGNVDVDSSYNRLFVYEMKDDLTGQPTRILQINDYPNSAIYLHGNGIVYPYAQIYHRLCAALDTKPQNILVLGGGGYTMPIDLRQMFPDASIEVVEIDPEITSLARLYFGLQDKHQLTIHHTDARSFLKNTQNTYDLILWDVFNSSSSVPFELTTIEAFGSTQEHLRQGGFSLLNIIAPAQGKGSHLLKSMARTISEAFPASAALAVQSPTDLSLHQNYVIVSGDAHSSVNNLIKRADCESLLVKHNIASGIILTDDYCPAEYLLNH